MRTSIVAIALASIALFLAAGAPVHAQETFPSRPITLIVPFPPGGSTDVAGRIIADKMGAFLGQPVIVENVGGAGGSIGVGRLARATPDGYTIDIGQWDTHVGSIIYNLNYDLQTDFDADRSGLDQSAASGRHEGAAGGRPESARGLDEGAPRRRQIRQPERGGAGERTFAAKAHRHQGAVHSLSRRRPGHDRSDSPGRSTFWSRKAPSRCRRSAPAPSRRS